MSYTKYTVGFLFNLDATQVALIQKLKHAWQMGKLNGIGGKVEDGENFLDCMIREFKEETGAEVRNWEQFAILHFREGQVAFFRAFASGVILHTTTDEQVGWYSLSVLPLAHSLNSCVSNLAWLIPMALDMQSRRSCIIEEGII